ncbi:hypothetical protein CASFOL_001136 [Castilleja foliolosa]|uniref:TFIIS N-terminal domain-containing protein n=1 Tax=Castilleja foliolosa TaxID=1961234 RepID=A0ABD3ELQ1_9LAMI
MYGRVHRSSKSCRSLGRSYSQHMRSVPPLETTNNTLALACDLAAPVTTSSSTDSFFKDGRKVSVGDCALFKPPKDSPPLIGLIRWLALNKENKLQLGVSWLRRLSELKLGKGTLVKSAPNEIFYSFQKDEVPAASLLHPCKVAFLPKGVELPTGKSSFICRRAYDNANKSLWWLTDRNYINDQQEEVAQLLYKTKTEMHVTLQPDARSPKQNNGPTLTSQPKQASDSGQNSGNSCPTQAKGKKREKSDHGADPVKRGRFTRPDEGDSVQCKTERNLKHEIAKITEKGGVVDSEGVEKLVQLMQPDRKERKMDLGSRSMLAIVLTLTENVDCLNRFVQLRGLPVLDGWLQDIHKGKLGDGNNLKDGDKSVEEFILILLRALDKLPVNLQALQMCNIGRSVNHLRSHKNTDIQRKARTLVDTWKKRVEAEMISIDATKSDSTQSVSVWASKSRLPEASHGGGSKTPDGAIKTSISQNSSAKTTPGRSSPGENSIKNETSSPGPVKLASTPASGKESQPRSSMGGTTDTPQTRDDRSSSSNQSHNSGQPFPAKDDLKSSTSGPLAVNKISSSTTRNRKNNGFPLTSATGGQKETSSSKNALAQKSTALEKLSHSASTGGRVVEVPISEGTSQKLIVKIPNSIRSPAQGVSGSSMEDPNIMSSWAPSPVLLKKHEHPDHASKEKSDASQRVIESQNNDQKDVLIGSEGARSPAVLPVEDQSMKMKTADYKRSNECAATYQSKSVKLHVSSFSPMNALVESCAKYSEATSSLSLDDDVGMNLLASVAAGEMYRSDMDSPFGSTERTTPAVEEVCSGDEAKSRSTPGDCPKEAQSQVYNDGECDGNKQSVLDGCPGLDDIPAVGNNSKDVNPFIVELRSNADPKWKITEKSTDTTSMTSKALSVSKEMVKDGESNGRMHEKATCGNAIADGASNCRNCVTDVMVSEEKANTDHLVIGECKPIVDHSRSKPIEGDFKKSKREGLNKVSSQPKLTAAIIEAEFTESASNKDLHQSECGQKSVLEAGGSVKVEEPEDKDTKSCMSNLERLKSHKDVERNANVESDIAVLSHSTFHDLNSHSKVAELENQDNTERLISESQCPSSVRHEAQEDELTGSSSSSLYVATDPCERMKFDLNEGFSDDVEKHVKPVNLLSTVPAVNLLPFSVNSVPGGHSASITVASAAVRPFVPPEDLLRSKVELGWKGSAATSAFRPAEPRKAVEMAIGPSDSSCPDASTSMSNRFHLDIDLNVTDERVLEEMASRVSVLDVESTTDLASNCATLPFQASTSMSLRGSGGLDLDLNLIDETNDTGHCGEASILDVKPATNLHIQRDFDLNDGPAVDDASVRQYPINQLVKGGIVPSQLPSVGLAMNNQGPGTSSFASWFSPGNTYSTVAIPSLLPERGEQQPFPVYPPGAAPQRPFGVAQFNPDMYRGSILSSSPAVPFPSNHFQYPVFPFGTTFPLPSGTFPVPPTVYPDPSSGARIFSPPVNSQYLGPVGNVASQFQRPYVVGLPGVSNNGGLNSNRKWARQGLDLNAGPGNMENEVKEEMLPYSSGQRSVASFQALAEEQARMFSVSGGILKRREPDDGWDNETARNRHSSWQ